MASNALVELREHEEDMRRKTMKTEEALLELQEYLDLDALPLRIECYDISNISGTDSVGSMVVFENGTPKPSDYRRFKIATVTGPDDFASMSEILRRRFKCRGQAGRNLEEGDGSFGKVPDLIIIDGGKGQLSAARQVMAELGVEGIPTFGLAKQQEELFAEGCQEPIILPRTSQSLYLLQRIRDEAHRFAVSYHRGLRDKKLKNSILDEVPGIGPKRKRALLRKFGSVKDIRRATVQELANVEGMNLDVAIKLQEYLGLLDK